MFKINAVSRLTHPTRTNLFELGTLVVGVSLLLGTIVDSPAFGATGEYDTTFAQGGICRFTSDVLKSSYSEQ